jgi:ATP-dependent Clp protease ATP-binding subunit ClpA
MADTDDTALAIVRALGLHAPTGLPGPVTSEITFSCRVQRVLSCAMLEADRLGQHRIRPEHLLLALHEERDSAISGVLQQAGLDRDELVRSAVQQALSDDSPLQYRLRLKLEPGRE